MKLQNNLQNDRQCTATQQETGLAASMYCSPQPYPCQEADITGGVLNTIGN